MAFYSESQMVPVSSFDQSGWWIGNGQVYVSAGTSLPPECTATIYNPSAQGMVGRFNPETGTWVERKDNRGTPFWSIYGDQFVIDTPDGVVANDFVKVEPPEYDHEKQEILFENGAWKIFEIRIGQKFWDAYQNEYLVSTKYWECPSNHTLKEPPTVEAGFGIKLVNGEWIELVDHRNKIFWDTITKEVHTITELGVEPEPNWTEKKPHPNSKWVDGAWQVSFDLWLVNEIKPLRNALLSATDFLYRSDLTSKMSEVEKQSRDNYCQLLRDFPETLSESDITDDVTALNWPTVPIFTHVAFNGGSGL